MEDYQKFLQSKQKQHVLSGFDINESELNEFMFPFQKFIVKRALKAGKYAIFADCGLGKTLMQLEWANQVCKETKGKVLILAPLAVVGQIMGIGSEVYQAVKMGRKGIGFELKESYFDLAKKNLQSLTLIKSQKSIF